ncbi:acyl-homoserine-lactone synthase [Glacieibacterium frigidum]|uniref:Acyl-homoserine-lactone synthase n=1 Tax=Glacieibacterium frigidum TaxID=2593303 RepID=A0A552U719_9SPHN|nr:acyl-homoserine-lactone synthase [Glacieibacterium frigidum]TRW14010.1 autoinducer synthase [Glacieibacterium frigidum]
MVAVVTAENRSAFAGTITQMHRDRKAVFVDALKWEIPVVDDAFEIDEYDTEAAVYLVAQEPLSGAHLGSVRLVCTAGPHLLGDKFAFLCADAVPTGDDVWEITRLCTTPGLTPAAALQVRMRLVMALMEYALAHGIARYTMMTHTAYLPTLLAVGWDIEPLGLPADVAGQPTGALQISVNAAALDRLRTLYGFRAPVIGASDARSAVAA